MAQSNTPAIIGRTLGFVGEFVLMALAAVAVDGWLRWALVGWLIFLLVGQAVMAAVHIESKK